MKHSLGGLVFAMPTCSFLAFLLLVGAEASVREHKQLPFAIRLPLPLPRDDRQLRGAPIDLEDAPVMGIALSGGIPLGEVALNVPQDVEETQGPAVVDGPLRDLLDFGSAFGAAVLQPGDMRLPMHRGLGGAEGKFGAPLELPLDALHVKMQEHVPKPLNIDDAHDRLRIYGTLPKNLTAKTLKVSLSGGDDRDLTVQYFLGQGSMAKNLVGIDEHFALDFAPAEAPAVKYKAATGAFELLLKRPAMKTQKQVAIDFDAGPATPPAQLPDLAAFSARRPDTATATAKVALGRLTPLRRTSRAPVLPKEFAHESHLKRMHASRLKEDLAKMTKDLLAGPEDDSKAKQDKAARVDEIRDRAKQFVSDAHLGDAQKELIKAFAPLDLGLVMLEMNHRVRAA